jgi:hypothetical protein
MTTNPQHTAAGAERAAPISVAGHYACGIAMTNAHQSFIHRPDHQPEE